MKSNDQNGWLSERAGGILLPVFSLPSPYGIGTLGDAAHRFVDFLVQAGQRCWQVLPVGPTGFADSPYQSFSTFAGNPYFIDLELLCRDGLLTEEECAGVFWGEDSARVDYEALYTGRFRLLRLAYTRADERMQEEAARFAREQRSWIGDYALFMALKECFGGAPWNEWERDIRMRKPEALKHYRIELADEIAFWTFLQYLFFVQWRALKAYANENGVLIIGDIPFYVAADSADVWANPELFELDATRNPHTVAGVPPDYFSETGQLWGNPIYCWEQHEAGEYAWWTARIAASEALYDFIRIDHFRGFASYYAIPADETTAQHGKWQKGPGMALFAQVKQTLGALPIIAEDLGVLTPDVSELLRESGFPGMRVLQFAFDEDWNSPHLPHNYENNCVAYTGTHDNDTAAGWWNSLPEADRAHAADYLRLAEDEGISWGLVRGIWASVARLSIAPMQDFLVPRADGRVNEPSTIGENWRYRLLPGDLTEQLAQRIERLSGLYQRSTKTV